MRWNVCSAHRMPPGYNRRYSAFFSCVQVCRVLSVLLRGNSTCGLTSLFDAMDSLPSNVGEEMTLCAWRASWHCSNTRKGRDSDAAKDKAMTTRQEERVRTPLAYNLRQYQLDVLGSTANTRWNYREAARSHRKKMEERYRSIRDRRSAKT